MAPLPSNNTNRIFVDYVTGGGPTAVEHTFQVRFQNGVPDEDVLTTIFDVLTGITPARFWQGWRIIAIRRQQFNSNFSLPIDIPANLAGFAGAGPAPNNPSVEAIEHSFQGRSTVSGRRVDLSLYGLILGVGNNFRYTAQEQPWVLAVANLLTAFSSGLGIFIAVDGQPAVWRAYLNANYNSYWERRLRLG